MPLGFWAVCFFCSFICLLVCFANVFFFFISLFSYDLDPDDGYGGRVLLPYESYYTKDYKSTPHIQSTVQPSYLPKPTAMPVYQFIKPKPINTFEPSVSYDPYEIAVTTHDTHQHLTETTPMQSQSLNITTTVEIAPLTFANVIPTATTTTATASSSKPLTEILQNMNRTSIQLLLTKLKENNHLPKTFTINKVDNSLRTLAKVLNDLKKSQKYNKNNYVPHSVIPSPQYTTPSKVHATKNGYDDVKSTYPPKFEG